MRSGCRSEAPAATGTSSNANNLLSSERDCMVYVRRLKERQNVIKKFRPRGFGWRIHCGVEVTVSNVVYWYTSTNKQHTLSRVTHPHGFLVLEAPEPKCGCSQVVRDRMIFWMRSRSAPQRLHFSFQFVQGLTNLWYSHSTLTTLSRYRAQLRPISKTVTPPK